METRRGLARVVRIACGKEVGKSCKGINQFGDLKREVVVLAMAGTNVFVIKVDFVYVIALHV